MPKSYTPNDKYFYKAKKDGYKARSAYKLEEIQNKFKIIKKNDHILDLGCYPGSFLQYISKIISTNGIAIGLDLNEVKNLKLNNIKTFKLDIFDNTKTDAILTPYLFDVITADLAPKTTGIKDIDHARSIELNEQVFSIAKRYLKKDGSIITKIFTGEDFDQFITQLKKSFLRIKIYKPKASRDRSKEVYIIAKKFKKNTRNI